MGLPQDRLMGIANDPRYASLVRERLRVSWFLSIVVMTIFFGYMLLVAFGAAWMSRPIAGSHTTIGIPLGLGVIVAGIGLTALYVFYANRRFDTAVAELMRDHAG